MTLKTPTFWYRPQSSTAPLVEKLLTPVSWLYAVGHALNQRLHKAQKIDVPVICIGNLVAGGSGKTPSALSLMSLIKQSGMVQNPHFLTRGYGGAHKGALEVNPRRHSAADCGDEALLLARTAPTIASRNRAAGGQFAAQNGAGLIILDDGLQNPSIYKDINIVVINGEMGFGNGRLLPAGPLRESLQNGLKNADAFILIGEDKRDILATLPDKPVFQARFSTAPDDLPPKDKAYIAFAGLGYPQKFFTYLRDDLGYDVIETISFADHHTYTQQDMNNLQATAKQHGAALITTEKDYVRLPSALNFKINTLPITLSWQNEAALITFLKNHPALQTS